ncbi:methionine gamma-lyase family protein [Shimazuella sp. AN120528]|uniref:methionine gamma-lyase family protein n=1 Tax=Shimazuella soli TaxID=1892854 RepID=UPI001F10FD68|nr:methionine gamma-lyase family protein [Shimazuella soli]MCH5586392.1 methionine gamma-lyase family protein [Shimazuella soli]
MSNVKTQQKTISKITPILEQIEERVERHQAKLLAAFQKHKVSETHLQSSTGYGYDDIGRETLERIVADLFGGESALVRPNIVSGTHAIAACLYGVLRPGDEWISLTGRPYDTLFQIIGSPDDGTGSLADLGVRYYEIGLTDEHKVDWAKFQQKVTSKTKLVAIQRSRGYSNRPSFTIAEIAKMITQVRRILPNAIIFVDNCYGEFVEDREPLHVGADLIAGSLIKNLGGGLAKSGGYIVGRKTLVELASSRLVAPGIGMEGGATHGYLADYYQGLFLAPHVVGEALKGMVFASALFEEAGYTVSPTYREKRTDIIQQIQLGSSEKLIAFCQAIQAASPIDAHVLPEPCDMPGYKDPIIMAAGTFVQGASIELSADGPLREPFTVYLQGGLTFAHVKVALKQALQSLNQIQK